MVGCWSSLFFWLRLFVRCLRSSDCDNVMVVLLTSRKNSVEDLIYQYTGMVYLLRSEITSDDGMLVIYGLIIFMDTTIVTQKTTYSSGCTRSVFFFFFCYHVRYEEPTIFVRMAKTCIYFYFVIYVSGYGNQEIHPKKPVTRIF